MQATSTLMSQIRTWCWAQKWCFLRELDLETKYEHDDGDPIAVGGAEQDEQPNPTADLIIMWKTPPDLMSTKFLTNPTEDTNNSVVEMGSKEGQVCGI